jgi:TP901 family phage tail tape measure protein
VNAMLSITIRVAGRQAQQQLQQVASSVHGVGQASQSAGAKAKELMSFFDAVRGSKMINAGKNLQWIGRQLTFNFTLPIVAAGAMLTKFSLSVERNMTTIRKLYGDFTFTTERVKEETDALARSFELLSTRFGVHQAEVVEIASSWAAAGSAGVALAENTQATLEMMILGVMEAEQATQALIAIQGVWRLSTLRNADGISELSQAIGQLNIVENRTGIRLEGLVEVMARAGGSARSAGMDIRELAAMAAALVPATGSATQAGNSLRTIISRLQAPTTETVKALELMGIVVDSPDWLGLSVTQKIETMAESFSNLSTANQNLVSSVIASRWQVNRFNVLMTDIASGTGYYAKAMDATADVTLTNAQYQRELLTVLESSPRRWDIMTNAIRNNMANAFLPAMPLIMGVLNLLARLTQKFAELPQSTKGLIVMALGFLAIVGPIAQMTGAILQLIGLFHVFAKFVGAVVMKILAPLFTKFFAWLALNAITLLPVLMSPWILIPAAIAAVLLALKILWDKGLVQPVLSAVGEIVSGLASLPRAVQNTMIALINVVASAMRVVIDWLSYLNPFQRHSPSLVDMVRAGVATILSEYAKFRLIPGMIASSIAALEAFKQATRPKEREIRRSGLQEVGNQVIAAVPGSAPVVNAVIQEILILEDQLDSLSDEISHQSIVVFQWKKALDAANESVRIQQDLVNSLESDLRKVSDAIREAQGEINRLANTPIQGMRDFEDQLFDNSMAQKRLRLELLLFEQAGNSIDQIRSKFAALNGEIESLRGEQEELRLAGAGADVLGVYEAQIAAIEGQRSALSDTEQQIIDIENQLNALDWERQFLELTQSLTFDPLLREIDLVANGINELPFDSIVASIREQQDLLAELQPQYDQLTASVEAELAVLQQLTAERDQILQSHDLELDKLNQLQDAYRGIVDMIREMESALNGFASASTGAAAAGGGAGAGAGGGRLENLFGAGIDSDYDIFGGDSILQPEGGILDIEAFNRDLEEQLQSILGGMGDFDIFAPIRQAWQDFKDWFSRNLSTFLTVAGALIAGLLIGPWGAVAVGAIALIAKFGPDIVKAIWEKVIQPAWEIIQGIAGFFADVFGPIISKIAEYGAAVFSFFSETLSPVFQWIAEKAGEFFGWIVGLVSPIVTSIIDIFFGIKDAVAGAIGVVMFLIDGFIPGVQAILSVLGDVFSTIWESVLAPIVEFLQPTIDGFKRMFDSISGFARDVAPIVVGVVGAIAAVFVALFKIVSPIITGLAKIWFTVFVAGIRIGARIISGIFNGIKVAVEMVFGIIGGILEVFAGLLTGDLARAWEGFLDIVRVVWANIWNTISTVVDVIKVILETLFAVLRIGFESMMQVVGFFGDLWSTTWEFMKSVGESVIAVIKAAFSVLGALISGIIEAYKTVWNAAWTAMKALAEPIINALGVIFGFFADLVSNAIEFYWDLWKRAWEAMKAIAEPIINGIRSTFDAASTAIKVSIEVVKTAVTGAWESIKNIVGGIMDGLGATWETVTTGIQNGLTKIGEIATTVWNGLKGGFETAWQAIAGAAKTAVNGVIGGFESLVNMAIRAINALIRGANSILGKIGINLTEINEIRLPTWGGVNVPSSTPIGWRPPSGGAGGGGMQVLHSGGLVAGRAGEEVLALLQAGEFVIPASVMQSLSRTTRAAYVPSRDAGGTVLVFHGDLVFPNIEDGGDAEEFIENLKAMV